MHVHDSVGTRSTTPRATSRKISRRRFPEVVGLMFDTGFLFLVNEIGVLADVGIALHTDL